MRENRALIQSKSEMIDKKGKIVSEQHMQTFQKGEKETLHVSLRDLNLEDEIDQQSIKVLLKKYHRVHLMLFRSQLNKLYQKFKYYPKAIHSEFCVDEEGKGQEFDEVNCISYWEIINNW